MNEKIQTQVVTKQFYIDVADILRCITNDDEREVIIGKFIDLFSRRGRFDGSIFRNEVNRGLPIRKGGKKK